MTLEVLHEIVTPAPSAALTQRDTVKAELGITGTTDDAFLDGLIAQASSAISQYCAYTFGVEELRDTFHIRSRPSWRDDSVLPLSKVPVRSVVTITADAVLLGAGTSYFLDTRDGLLKYMSGGSPASWGASVVAVQYTAGYTLPGVPGYTLPGVVERACVEMVKMGVNARKRDPALRSETILDIVTRTWYAPSDSSSGGLPTQISALLDNFRTPVIA